LKQVKPGLWKLNLPNAEKEIDHIRAILKDDSAALLVNRFSRGQPDYPYLYVTLSHDAY